jgi:hypothetical protein
LNNQPVCTKSWGGVHSWTHPRDEDGMTQCMHCNMIYIPEEWTNPYPNPGPPQYPLYLTKEESLALSVLVNSQRIAYKDIIKDYPHLVDGLKAHHGMEQMENLLGRLNDINLA